MAYSTSNPPVLVTESPIQGPGQRWMYRSTDAANVVDVAGYITNGGDLGMKVGDVVECVDTSTGIISAHRVVTVSATAPGAVDLGDGTVIGSATNTH